MKPLSSALRGLVTATWIVVLAGTGQAWAKVEGITGTASTGTSGETVKTFNLDRQGSQYRYQRRQHHLRLGLRQRRLGSDAVPRADADRQSG